MNFLKRRRRRCPAHSRGVADGTDDADVSLTQRHSPAAHPQMSSHNHMPPVPPANRTKDAGASHAEVNTAEQGDTANIRQNTTNKGFLQGRRVK